MTYPLDQIILLAKANGQLMLKLADISRTSSQQYAQIGTKAASQVADRLKALQPGQVPAFATEGAEHILGDIQKVREETLGKVQGVFEEWQGSWSQLLSSDGPRELADSMQGFFKPFLTAGVATAPASQASARPAAAARAPAAKAD